MLPPAPHRAPPPPHKLAALTSRSASAMGSEHRAPLRPARHGRSKADREAGMGRWWAPGICAVALLWLAAAATGDPDPDELERA